MVDLKSELPKLKVKSQINETSEVLPKLKRSWSLLKKKSFDKINFDFKFIQIIQANHPDAVVDGIYHHSEDEQNIFFVNFDDTDLELLSKLHSSVSKPKIVIKCAGIERKGVLLRSS